MRMNGSGLGFVLSDSSLVPVYANAEAVRILAYPEDPETIEHVGRFLAGKIRSLLLPDQFSPEPAFVTGFVSGRRHYLCRAFSVKRQFTNSSGGSTVALLFERAGTGSFDCSHVAERFRLTRREQQAAQFLVQGLTNKEIATRMGISPNTVKAFLKLIMIKTGTSTRSGIIGKLFDSRL